MVSIFVSTHPPRHANSSLTTQTAQKSRQTTHKKTQSQAINAQNPRTLAKKRPLGSFPHHPRQFSLRTNHKPTNHKRTNAQTHKPTNPQTTYSFPHNPRQSSLYIRLPRSQKTKICWLFLHLLLNARRLKSGISSLHGWNRPWRGKSGLLEEG